MKKITFNRNFTSPVFGNVWIGRTIEVKPKDAEKYVNMGWADMVMDRDWETKSPPILSGETSLLC